MDRESPAPTPFLLRQVRMGVIATALVVASLALAYFALDHPEVDTVALAVVLGLAAIGDVVIGVLPWARLLRHPRGMLLLYAWSVVDIVLISFAIAATGGDRSDLFLLYSLTTLFFVASYPPAAQVVLLLFTATSYTVVLVLSGWQLTPGAYVARLSTLGVLAYLAGYLSRELLERATAEATARAEADQRATLLSRVAEAGRDMSLDPTQVVDVATDAVIRLGFTGASFAALGQDGSVSHFAATRGPVEDPAIGAPPADLDVTELVVRRGESVILDPPPSPDGGDLGGAVVASPVWVGGWMAAVLIGRMPGARPARHEVEAFELLATHAGFSLDNAGRYEEQRRTVERLEEADRLKSDFMTTVSHELRTPLTSILGNARTLEGSWHGLDEETRRDLLGRLSGNARVLEGKITDLLDFSRWGSGSHPGERLDPIDLSRLLRASADAARPSLSRHRLRVEVPEGLATRGDEELLARVLANLLSNAATHTPVGTEVVVSATRSGPEIEVRVRDDGPGIPAADVPYLGDRFYRGGDINARPGGMGLGLALASEILAVHGSSLEIVSREGGGSVFSFRLPDAASTDDASAEAPALARGEVVEESAAP